MSNWRWYSATTALRPRWTSPGLTRWTPGESRRASARESSCPYARAKERAPRRPRRPVVEVRRDGGRDGRPAERRLAGQRRVEQAPERVDVAADVGRLAAQLLGRHEVDRPEPLVAVGGDRRRVDRARDAE